MDIFSDIPVIIPSLQPDERLIGVVEGLSSAGFKTLVAVDDGSGADYRSYFDRLAAMGCVVLRHAVNLGKGRALKTAFNYCLLAYPGMLGCLTIDSDGQHSPQNALDLARALAGHPDELIIGCRDFSSPDVPFKNRWGNRITVGMFKVFCGVSCSDTQTGLRAIPAAFMRELMGVTGERFEFESYMLVEAKRRGVELFEVPIQTIYQKSYTTHFNPFRDSLLVYGMFIKYIGSSLVCTALDIGLYALLVELLAPALPKGYIALSTVMARVISASLNYTINLKTVFRTKSSRSLLKYLLLAGGIMLCSALFTTLLHVWLQLGEVLTKIIVDSVLFIANFFLQREFVFKGASGAEAEKE